MKQETGSRQGGGLLLNEDEAATVARVLDNVLQMHTTAAERLDPKRSSAEFATLARNVLQARRQRKSFLSPSLMGEPAWDMLLAVYIAPEGLPVTEAVEQSGAAPTTALRWLEHLKDHGLVEKARSEVDRRIWLVSISQKGRAALDSYFASMPQQLLGLG